MSIFTTLALQPITATITSGGVVDASVTSSTASASLSGGVGPTGPQGAAGPQGPQGPPGSTTIAGASDVLLTDLASGDVLRFSNNKFRNFRETDLSLDGGNW